MAWPSGPINTTNTDAGTKVPATARSDERRPLSSDDQRVHYALGVRGRLLVVPEWMLSPFLDQNSGGLTSGSFGLEFTRRKGGLDIITSLDYTAYPASDGNFLGAGKDPRLDTHFTQFRGLGLLSLDVTFVWHHDVQPWLAVMVGGGFGLGVVLGDIGVINASSAVCDKGNAGNPSACYPISSDLYTDASGKQQVIGAIKPDDPDFQRKLDGTAASAAACNKANSSGTLDCRDTALHPHFHPAAEKPPVMVVLNFLVGLRFKVQRHFNVNVSGGFRDGWFFGAGPEYVF